MDGTRHRILTVMFCLLTAGTALGMQVELRVVVAGAADGVSLSHPVDIEVAGVDDSKTRMLRLGESDSLKLEVADEGVWYLTPHAKGFWGETAVLVAPSNTENVDLTLWPASTLHAELPEKPEVTAVRVRFLPAEESTTASARVPPSSQSDCRIEARKVQCTIPAGRLDYSVRIPGYVPHYRWNQSIEPGKDVDLGLLELREGVALLGRVITRPGETLPDGAVVKITLVPQVPLFENPEDLRRSAIIGTSVTADGRGRFVFQGVSPGGYLISANAPGMISERREVTLIQGLEAELREPLVVSRPITLAVVIEPATDPWGQPWVGELVLFDMNNTGAATIEQSPAGPDGRWQRENLIPGDYHFKVRRTHGVWYAETLKLEESTTFLAKIPLTRVQGVLKLGDEPIAGSIWFGGQHGALRVPVRTDSEGMFRSILPEREAHTWPEVDVVSNDPHVRTNLSHVKLTGPDEKGIFSVEIVLPSNRLYGEVVNERGLPARANATVFASLAGSDAAPFQADVDEGGMFALNGLPAGSYSVSAQGRDGTSRSTNVLIEDESDEYVTLTLSVGDFIEGAVLSPNGPVVSASIHLYPEDRTGFGIVESAQTGVDGTFRIRVVPQAGRLTMTVVPPGYAFKFFEIPVQPREPIVVAVEQIGGRLVAVLPEGQTSRYPLLFNGGGYVALSAFARAGVGAPRGNAFVVENLAPGRYELCMATPHEALAFVRGGRPRERCAGGFLAPGGELTLAAPAPDPIVHNGE